MKRRISVKAITIILMVLAMVIPTFNVVHAADPTIGDYGKPMDNIEYFDFDLNTYDANKSNVPNQREFGANRTYTAYYPNSFTYFNGKKYSLKIDINCIGENEYISAGNQSVAGGSVRGVGLTSEKGIDIGAFGYDYDVTFTFYGKDTFADADKVKIYGAVILEDPDQSNYLIANANKMKIYYQNVKNKQEDNYQANTLDLKDWYNVTSEGIIHKNRTNTNYVSWPNFNSGKFAVLIDNKSSFNFKIQGKQDDVKLTAGIMKVMIPYKVEYYYEKNGQYPANPDSSSEFRYVDAYDSNRVSVTTEDKNPTKDGYVLDSTKDNEWSKTINRNGSTILKVYFNQQYNILYNANGGEGKMRTDTYVGSDTKMPSKDKWTFTRKGYEFTGFKLENKGDIKNGSVDYKSVLLKESDRQVELFAQWNPLNYTIKYNKNADDATGEMADDNYKGSDASMASKADWTFTRDRYDFIGFKLENKGDVLNGEKDYKNVLLEDEDRIITLYAQWQEQPKQPQKGIIHYVKAHDMNNKLYEDYFFQGESLTDFPETNNTHNQEVIDILAQEGWGVDVNGYLHEKFDDDTEVDQEYTITFGYTFEDLKEGEKKTIKRTIEHRLKTADGEKLFDDVVQEVIFTRKGSVNMVTKEIVWDEWKSDDDTFDKYDAPLKEGHSRDKNFVDEVKVAPEDEDMKEVIIYTPEDKTKQKAIIKYQDESGKSLHTDITITGDSNSPLKYDSSSIIKELNEKRYELVSTTYKENLKFDDDTTVDQIYVYIFKLKKIPVHFVDKFDYSKIDDQEVYYGEGAKEPKIPTHPGYSFVGWDRKFDRITEEITIYALWKPVTPQNPPKDQPKVVNTGVR